MIIWRQSGFLLNTKESIIPIGDTHITKRKGKNLDQLPYSTMS